MTDTGVDALRERLASGRRCCGLWSLLPGAITGEVLARTGADYVFLDWTASTWARGTWAWRSA